MKVRKSDFKDFMKRGLRAYISKSMHMQSLLASSRGYSALFFGINQVLKDHESVQSSQAALADELYFSRANSASHRAQNGEDRHIQVQNATTLDVGDRQIGNDVHLLITEERLARRKLEAQIQGQLSEMGGKIDALTEAVGTMNMALRKAMLPAHNLHDVKTSAHDLRNVPIVVKRSPNAVHAELGYSAKASPTSLNLHSRPDTMLVCDAPTTIIVLLLNNKSHLIVR
jgi:hypothetical protein